MISNFTLIFCSGLTFTIGRNNLAIGIILAKNRSYLFFGLLSLFASAFLFLQVSAPLFTILSGARDIVSIFIAVVFYTLFIWFIGAYTNYRKTGLQIIIP